MNTYAYQRHHQRAYAYVDSLPRGEQKKAMNVSRQYACGLGKMERFAAIERGTSSDESAKHAWIAHVGRCGPLLGGADRF